MAILSSDLNLLKSAIMSDAPESGGGLTEAVIVDGLSNNIFDDISTIARTNGTLMARKFFAKLKTQTNDKLYGSHVIVSKLPKDKKLGINLFNTADHYDVRPDAISRVENYKGEGAKYLGFLYGRQYKGSQILNIFQSISTVSPAAGEVLRLVAANKSQYVRCVAVNDKVQEFTDAQGVYSRKVVSVELSSVLKEDFDGIEITRLDGTAPPTQIYKTTVADAARYFSARYLKNATAIGDFSVTLDSIYSQLIPSSQSQTPLLDLNAGSNCTPLVSAGNSVSFITGAALSASVNLYLGRACYPNTLNIAYSGGAITDNAGNVLIGGTTVGTIDYTAGRITFGSTAPSLGGTKTVSFIPASAPLTLADTDSIPVTEASRSFVYVLNINPPPQPNALSVSYLAQGNWFELRDNGSGGLVSPIAGVGAGTVDYATGSVSVTLAALPDAGSEIVFAWGKKADFQAHSGNAVGLEIVKQLSHTALDAASLVISWNDGANRTITSNAAGVLSGDGTGSVIATIGKVKFKPTTLPPKDTVFTFNYLYGDGVASKVTKNIETFTNNNGIINFSLDNTNIVAGSLVLEWDRPWGSSLNHNTPALLQFYLNNGYIGLPLQGNGSQQFIEHDNASGALLGGRGATINYQTGSVLLDINSEPLMLKFPAYNRSNVGSTRAGSAVITNLFVGYFTLPAEMFFPVSFTAHYRLAGSPADKLATDTLTLSSASLSLVTATNNALVPSSVLFTFAGKNYIDRLGQLYYDVDPTTGAGIYGGTIDYASATCALSSWVVGAANTGTLSAALSTANFAPVDRVAFRTASAPVKPASFSIRATPVTGGQITATANEGGVISTADMIGLIDNNTGVVKVKFGAMVTAAGNEVEPWFSPDNVVGGQVFKPKPVLAESIVYNAVSYTYIPLSPDILGIDPVRLPIDGRVPIYHKGDILVILNDQTTVGTFASSGSVNLGRVRLAKVVIKDLGGNLLPANKWTADLDTGIVSFGDLSGVSQPLTIIDRIEDMAVCTDVQITGKLSLSSPVTHVFPPDSTLVANAVVLGDKYARASVPFDQKTWTSVWSNSIIGDASNAQYNANAYPIEMTNSGAIEERWALIFTNATTFNVIGEHVGQIVTGASIGNDCAPLNPANNDPYFTLNHWGWGGGWSSGNVLRFNTYAAASPLWALLSVGQGAPTDSDYGFCVEFRGDIDAP